jgi:hypothetical protein
MPDTTPNHDTHPLAADAIRKHKQWQHADTGSYEAKVLAAELLNLIPTLAAELDEAVFWADATRRQREAMQARELDLKDTLERIEALIADPSVEAWEIVTAVRAEVRGAWDRRYEGRPKPS